MALTITVVKKAVEGNRSTVYADITGDSSYPTGGEALSQADLDQLVGRPGAKITELAYFASEVNAAGYKLCLNRAASKVVFFDADSEVVNGTNLSAVTVRVAASSFFN